LYDLHDVDITFPELNNQYLKYSTTVSQWINSFINQDVYTYLNSSMSGINGITLTSNDTDLTFTFSLTENGVTPGEYNNVTVDEYGRVLSGTNVAYAPPTSGTSILYGNGSGGFDNVTVGSGLSFTTGTLSATSTVSSVSVATANGFAGTVATPTTTPVITLETTINGVIKGNGTAISLAVAGTDYSAGTSGLSTGIVKSTTGTGALTIAIASDFPILNQNTTGNAATATTSVNISGRHCWICSISDIS